MDIKLGKGGKWKRIEVKIPTVLIFIRKKGMSYAVMYKNIRIARLYCSGLVEFIDRKKWKAGWEFKTEYDTDGNKHFYKRIIKFK